MTLGISGIIAAYVLLAVLLLNLSLYSSWSWRIKATSIVLTSAFYILSYFSFPPLLGWSTQQVLPEHFRLLSAHVVQPDKQHNTKGNIYLWIAELKNMSTMAPPRAYKLPYSEPLHDIVIATKSRLDKGIEQIGEFKEPEKTILEPGRHIRTSQVSDVIKFYDIPDPLFPEK